MPEISRPLIAGHIIAAEVVEKRLQLLDDAYSTTIVFRGDWEPYGLYLTCDQCGKDVCRIASGDTLGGLLNHLRDHDCTPSSSQYERETPK